MLSTAAGRPASSVAFGTRIARFNPDDDSTGKAGRNEIKKAQAWLKENHLESRAPGFDKEPARLGWSDGLRLYYAAAVIRAMPGLPIELPPQREDGSFVNTNNLVKEDDPILASGLVLRCMPT